MNDIGYYMSERIAEFNEMYRNSEGYLDMTAGKAMEKMGETSMEYEKNMNTVHAGDVYKTKVGHKQMNFLVMSATEKYVLGFVLLDKECDNDYEIELDGHTYHTDCARGSYGYYDRLGLKVGSVEMDKVVELRKKLAKIWGMDKPVERVVEKVVEKTVEIEENDMELEMLKVELRVQKEMYRELLMASLNGKVKKS